ncbi:DUF3106 domain-containing protein [Trinickia soli]|uniref:DUF3106 domain-containing protein n=1 Tax=Trinickia soli TaxID=380675 RepID=A0A2N7VRZ6_9BURK|nr:DUF3106 domain-containing protein [Trinickia soli]PMS19909.1 hypothetical protein C0Z19_20825 [Trinickia soli]CAB3685866.1 hypothetical protein LMG24076_02681 [Trinickia soli]
MTYKRGLAVLFGCTIAVAVAFAATYPRFFGRSSAAQPAGAPGAASSSTQAPLSVVEFPPLAVDNNPLSWAHLSAAQHEALAPFAAEWDTFGEERKRKWIKIAARFAKMSPEAQKRLHERMAQWVGMTPDQRRVARENYQVSKALPPQARQKAWQAYQQLSPEQKAKLAALERKRRPTVVSAPPSGQRSEVRGLNRLVNRSHGASAAAAASAPGGASAVAVAPGSTSDAAAASAPVNTTVPVPATPMSPSDAPSVFRGA